MVFGLKKSEGCLSEKDLSHWKLIQRFRELVERAAESEWLSATDQDPRRKFHQSDYLCLMLFGLVNPAIKTMRGLCAASRWKGVEEEICNRRVSLGSFSEMQAVVDPGLLEKVFEQLVQEKTKAPLVEDRLREYRDCLVAVDSTLIRAVPRMAWAVWRPVNQQAVRLHVKFNVFEQKPVAVVVTAGKGCERKAWKRQIQAGEFYVGDRYFGQDFALLDSLCDVPCSFVIRLREQGTVSIEQSLALTATDRAAGIIEDSWVRLGSRQKTRRLRRVIIQGEKEKLILITNQPPEQLPAELISLIYRYRWQIELFFKWLKCILGCRHWLAHSSQGVAIQVYCALIAALLLFSYTGKKPSRRQMELIHCYVLGYVSDEELIEHLGLKKILA
jgi:hypothetical protein